jgi:hypothetical protein
LHDDDLPAATSLGRQDQHQRSDQGRTAGSGNSLSGKLPSIDWLPITTMSCSPTMRNADRQDVCEFVTCHRLPEPRHC